MSGLYEYSSGIEPGWIDYNGHLRDAYYTVILSSGIDALMDHLGIDAAYRSATRNTLYTLEMHLRFLREVKAQDRVLVRMRILDADRKRIHLASELLRAGSSEAAATAEFMLLHVHQGVETVTTVPFPPPIEAAVSALQRAGADLPPFSLGSRRMGLRPA